MTTFLIGVDEAGYGPNLGPLVVAATVWQVDAPGRAHLQANKDRHRKPIDLVGMDWYACLADRVSLTADPDRIAIADSKSLYSPATGLTLLEEGVLSALQTSQTVPTSWSNLVDLLDADANGAGTSLPWHRAWDTLLPIAACPDRVEQLAECLGKPAQSARRGKQRPHISLHGVAACLVHPARFNRLTAESDSKATALSRTSLELLARAIARLPTSGDGAPPAVLAVCDKHGGRAHYAPLLAETFSQTLIQVRRESRAISRYCMRIGAADVDVSFQCRGETFLPTALASMTAKYMRELAMRAFNDFWTDRVPGLRPTAGYPVDSYRFKRDIADAQMELGIDDEILWRSR